MLNRLTGKALLQKIEELNHLGRMEKAKGCGYYTVTKEGVERIQLSSFYNAILEAENLNLEPKPAKSTRGGSKPSYRITVQTNGSLLVGAAYTKELGLKPGDKMEVKIGYKNIHLIKFSREEQVQVMESNRLAA